MTRNFSAPTFKVQLGDLELYTAPDMGFSGSFSVTPKIHSHPYYEIISVIDGGLTIKLLDNKVIELEKGSLCILPPECYHCTCAESNMTKMLAIRLSYRKVSGGAKMYDRFSAALESISEPTCFISPESLPEVLLEIRREMKEKSEAWDFACNALLQKLYVEIYRLLTKSGGKEKGYTPDDSKHSRYYRIEMWFADNLANQITEDDLADEISLSSRQLSRVLADIYGMSFREKLVDLRLHRAAQLLEQTELNIESIATAVGYRSLSGFHRAFLKHFGCSAYKYRKNIIKR